MNRRGGFRPTLIALAVALSLSSPAALANPTGAAVVHGSASIQQSGNLLTITNGPSTIINWQSFSIGAGEITRFIQQSAASAVLNRVVSQNPSAILGALQSNGRVFLINPNGIAFGSSAQVDVAGLVASTLNLSNEDFLAGRMRFTEVPGAGAVTNDGAIRTASGGSVYLVGADVANGGVITSPGGEVVLAAGSSVELVDPATPELRVQVAAAEHEARNLGAIVTDAGRVGIYAGLVTQAGTVQADSAVSEGGRILLKAIKNVTLDAGSVTTANGPKGGTVTIEAGDTALVAGIVEARATGFPQGEGEGGVGKGGAIQLLGDKVGVIGSATIDASGAAGGGTVLVGGDFQGRNPETRNAARTYVGADTTIRADATDAGDGGTLIVWSDEVTRAYGEVSARGGPNGGNGGFVEVSGKMALDFAARVDATAPLGAAGTLLLDPTNVVVANGGAAVTTEVDAFADPGGTLSIAPAALEAAGATVVLQATDDIAVQSAVTLTTPAAGFVAQAGRHITISAPVTTSGGDIILEADSPHSPVGGGDGTGQTRINALVSTRGNGATGGAITLIAGGNDNPNAGGFEIGADVLSGTGGLNLTLTQSGTLKFGIGARGNTQLTSEETDHLQSTGALVIGQGTTAGTDGLGSGAIVLTVNSIENVTAAPIDLSGASGSSFELIANDSILLGKPILSFQDTFLTTLGSSGIVTINQPINTSDHDLTIDAVTVILNASINTGTGSLICANCPGFNKVTWDGGAGDSNWFNPANWAVNGGGQRVPIVTDDVIIPAGAGTIVISGSAVAKVLTADSPISLTSGSLTLAGASQTSSTFTLSGGMLDGAGGLTVGGSGGSLVWSGGAMAGSGTVFLMSGNSGTLSNALALDRILENAGTLALVGANISGRGTIDNIGTMTVSGSTLSVAVVNASPVQFVAGTNVLAPGSGLSGGTVDFLGGAVTFQSGAAFDVETANVSGGAVKFDGDARAGTLNLTSGSLDSSGTVTVESAFNWNGGALAGSGTLAPGASAAASLAGTGARILNGVTLSLDDMSLNGGSLAVQSGTLNAAGKTTIGAGATLSVQGGAFNGAGGTVDVAGIIEANGGSAVSGMMNVLAGGTLRGGGTVTANVNNAGTVAPGTSSGTLTINGNYVQAPSGALAVEIGGATPGTQHDRLVVNGAATLDGMLSLALAGGFLPGPDEVFNIVQASGGVSGTFASVSSPAAQTFTPEYLASAVNAVAGSLSPAWTSVADQSTTVAAVDQTTNFEPTATSGTPVNADSRDEEEEKKRPICSGGTSGGSSASASIGGGGGATARCTARGCY